MSLGFIPSRPVVPPLHLDIPQENEYDGEVSSFYRLRVMVDLQPPSCRLTSGSIHSPSSSIVHVLLTHRDSYGEKCILPLVPSFYSRLTTKRHTFDLVVFISWLTYLLTGLLSIQLLERVFTVIHIHSFCFLVHFHFKLFSIPIILFFRIIGNILLGVSSLILCISSPLITPTLLTLKELHSLVTF